MAQMLQTINANRSTLTPGKVAISPAFAADEKISVQKFPKVVSKQLHASMVRAVSV
jgi:hypothetical protein